jgi:hypothetical protein
MASNKMKDYIDIFEYVESRAKKDSRDFLNSYLCSLNLFAMRYKRFGFFAKLFELFSIKKKVDLLFVGSRFSNLAFGLKGTYKVGMILYESMDILKCLSGFQSYVPCWDWLERITECYHLRNSSQGAQKIKVLIEEIEKCLIVLSPRAIILSNDSLFLERVIAYAARNVGIKIVTLQDGLFMDSSPSHIYHGRYSDFIMLWGEYFKEVYLKNKVCDPSRIIVMGYPFEINATIKKSLCVSNIVVCMLGQPWESYYSDLWDAKCRHIRMLYTICRKLGFEFIYRPHPFEVKKTLISTFPWLNFTSKNESLEDSIYKYDIFLSQSSTALVEAAIRGKYAVQLIDASFLTENYQELGVCYAVAANESDVSACINDIIYGRSPIISVNKDFIGFDSSPELRFVEALKKTVLASSDLRV